MFIVVREAMLLFVLSDSPRTRVTCPNDLTRDFWSSKVSSEGLLATT